MWATQSSVDIMKSGVVTKKAEKRCGESNQNVHQTPQKS